jgi:Raf kinase inhibitor-like YbhB/YbcL family protein
MVFQLTSPDFADGGRIPTLYTCDGDDASPPLVWSGAPSDTESFVLLCDDPDAPLGTWHHWAVFNIPPAVHGLDKAYPTTGALYPQAVNDLGSAGYGGPCPPPGHGIHHYHFQLLALNTPSLDLPKLVKCTSVAKAAHPYIVDKAEIIGVYSRDRA